MLVGDAVGVPYEFHRAANIPPRELIDMVPPAGFARAHRGVPTGTWSDDGAQALALLDSLLTRGALDLDHFAERLLAWFEDGAYTPDGRVFDIGIQTRRAFSNLREGVSPESSGPSGERENGNGSLMRVLPLASFFRGASLETLVREAERSSLPTHGHVRSRVICVLACVWARHELEGHDEGFARAVSELRELYTRTGDAERLEVIDAHVRPEEPEPGRGSGYVVDTIRSVRDCLRERTFEDVVRAAIALGDDTDTTACVAGGLAGLRFGVEAIPERWLEGLKGKEQVSALLSRLELTLG